jgi:hypothetical protein
MVFGSKSKKKKESLVPEAPEPEDFEKAEESVKSSRAEPMPAPEQKTPPLFIKVDRYKDIIKNIQELKSYALGLRDALDALADIEKELKTGLELTNKALDRFNTIISLLDAKLLKFHEGGDEARVPGEMDEYVKNLYDQMEKIRHELRTIEPEARS